jgi:hypothetical protein
MAAAAASLSSVSVAVAFVSMQAFLASSSKVSLLHFLYRVPLICIALQLASIRLFL